MKPESRRRAREVALQVLYCLDVNPELDPAAALALYFDRFAEEASEAEAPVPAPWGDGGEARGPAAGPIDRPFLEALVMGVSEHRAEIDEKLTQLSRNWRVERIARVERNILRLALFELEHRPDIPARVALNEAIELAKAFGAADAPAFVNGLLDSALHQLASKK
jgi:N utilization substance protein B